MILKDNSKRHFCRDIAMQCLGQEKCHSERTEPQKLLTST
jgi:hypothetical protein